MACGQEKKPSQKAIDSAFNLLRNVDVQMWTGQKSRVDDIKGDIGMIKNYLDAAINNYEIETGAATLNNTDLPKPIPSAFANEPRKTNQWSGTLVWEQNPFIENKPQF